MDRSSDELLLGCLIETETFLYRKVTKVLIGEA